MATSSPLPPPLGSDRTRRLRHLRGAKRGAGSANGKSGKSRKGGKGGRGGTEGSDQAAPGAASAPPVAGGAGGTGGTSGIAGAAGGLTALPRRSKAKARRAAKRVLRRSFEVAGGRAMVDGLNSLHQRVQSQREQLDAMRAGWVDEELRRSRYDRMWQEIEANRVNLELLKGELRELQHTLQELGMAFAPSAGLAGAASRFAELRENVNGLERRLRNLSFSQPGAVSRVTENGEPPPPTAGGPAAPQTSALFNYVGFERRFRGDPEVINAALVERYGDLLAANQPVVDIGCGRAELLETLAARGVEVIGVEPDAGMVAEGRARGVTVHQALAGEYLRGVEDGTLGSIITTHVAEHLPLDALIEMLELAVRKLRPGGVLVSETPNPSSLIVLGTHYIIDPTHVWPLHPSLLAFLCESAGFRDVRVRFFSPANEYHLAHVEVPQDAPEWAGAVAGQVNTGFDQLNTVLFGPQDYAVVATTPTPSEPETPPVRPISDATRTPGVPP